jgi:hypothetical protein
MRTIIGLLILTSLVLMLVPGCKQESKGSPKVRARSDSPRELVVADTITYEVRISNPNPEDAWTAKCLGRLNRKALIDSIFAMVYENRVVAYNHETNERLTPKQLEKNEASPGFNRDNIGMIQFTEAWYLNPADNTMTKKVLSMVLGYNYYAADGELFGQKPVFRLEMKKRDE